MRARHKLSHNNKSYSGVAAHRDFFFPLSSRCLSLFVSFPLCISLFVSYFVLNFTLFSLLITIFYTKLLFKTDWLCCPCIFCHSLIACSKLHVFCTYYQLTQSDSIGPLDVLRHQNLSVHSVQPRLLNFSLISPV